IERIIQRHIFNKSDEYIQQMIDEMESRHRDRKNIQWDKRNIKEDIGGLRDIETILLIYKAKHRLSEPINQKLMETICQKFPKHHDDLCTLAEIFNFFKNLRDLYHLTVTAEDYLNFEYLDRVAVIMGFNDTATETAKQQLVAKYQKCTEDVAQIIKRLVTNFN
ncbi:MAG: hypothetical protein ACFFDN_35045, partial [Candidatus Hodarchaeota archaeon]